MTVLTSQTEAAASHVSSLDYYIWDEPERSVSVHLNYQMVERLQIEALRALDSNSDGGVEIGGILLGRREHVAGRVNTFIEEFVPVQCGYPEGSVYSLTDGDALKFEAALKRCKSESASASSVLGFFRSHLRDDVFLSPDDLTLIRHFFPDPDSLVLLIKTLPSRGCTAAFFFWEDGRIQSEGAYNEVPLSPVQFGPAAYREKQTVELPRSLQTVPSVRRLPRVAPAAAVALAVVAMALGALGYWMKWGIQQPGTRAGADVLGLHVERSSDRLAVTWSRNAAEIASADRAVLSIRDGSYQKAFSLNRTQLRTGVVTYKPDSQNVNFDLEVYRGRTEVVRDTLHVFLEGAPRATTAEPSPIPSEDKGAPVPPKSASTIVVVKQENPPRTERLPLISNARGNNDPGKSSSTPVSSRIFKPPQATGSPDASNRIPIGSAVTDAPIDAPEVGFPLNPKIDGVSIPPIPPALTQKIDWPGSTPNQAQPAPQVASPPRPAASAQPRRSTYVGPQVLQRVNPVIARDVRSKMPSDIEVDVTVFIDTNGAVTDARVVSTKGGLPGLVANEALRAARLFRFSPASENDRNIASQMTLSFRFLQQRP